MNILVVDDCDMMCVAIGEYLAEKLPDADLNYAYDGDEALRRIAELAPSLVILNIVMQGKTGFDVLAQVRANGNDVPVLLTSGYAEEEVYRRGTLEDERVRFLCKPFKWDTFMATTKELLSIGASRGWIIRGAPVASITWRLASM